MLLILDLYPKKSRHVEDVPLVVAPFFSTLGFTLSRSACCRRTGMRRMSYGGGYGPKNMQNKSEQFIAWQKKT